MKQKHKFNFFPEMSSEDTQGLRESISKGFDVTLGKITLYQDQVLDGWNRYKACIDTDTEPVFTNFQGNDNEAFNFSISANLDRRHLSSSQKAAMAVDAEPLLDAIEKANEEERRKKQAETLRRTLADQKAKKEREEEAIRRENTRIEREAELKKQQVLADERRKKEIEEEKIRIEEERRVEAINKAKRLEEEKSLAELNPSNSNREEKTKNETRTKLATAFGTNSRYISDAKKLKANSPELYKEVLAGEKTITEVKKEKKTNILEAKKKENSEILSKEVSKNKPTVYNKDCVSYLNTLDDNSIDLLITDPPYSTDVDDINEFANHWVDLALSKVKKGGRAFICIGAYPKEVNAYLDILLKQDKFIVDNPLIWEYKNTLGITPKMKYNLNYQMILHLYSADSKELDTSITSEMWNVMNINAPDGRIGNRYHTWQKPDELGMRLIKHATKEGDKVVDCFSCTGTFLLMASKMSRVSEGCDISSENLEIAKERGCTIIGD